MQYGASRLSRVALAAHCRSKLSRGRIQLPQRWQSTSVQPPALPPREWSTPLAKTIAQAIEVTGPISIAAYMRQCLTNPDGGYYTTTRPASDQFGEKGDFITSPEISQIFGELVGIWFMTEWMFQGRPSSGVQFMEVGPGRGTLMADILRTLSQFKAFAGAVEGVWLVEAGENLRKQQKDLLCGENGELKEVQDNDGRSWWECRSKYGSGIPVRWIEDVALLPQTDSDASKMPFIIAHEFFDALPIFAFESVAPDPNAASPELLGRSDGAMSRPSSASKVPQWRELLVSPTKRKLSIPTPTGTIQPKNTDLQPDFQLTLAKASNPSSLILPDHPRYRRLRSQPGSRVEISPESTRYIQDFARRIGGDNTDLAKDRFRSTSPRRQQQPSQTQAQKPNSAGAALIIDYGPLSTVPINSLRGIRAHRVVSPFLYAGQTDISADVDFTALADAAIEASEHIEVHGPVEQGIWLGQLGIKERAERLLKSLKSSEGGQNDDEISAAAVLEDRCKDIETGWKRLVEGGPTGMGKAYKVMAIIPENKGKRRPVGFGGDIAV